MFGRKEAAVCPVCDTKLGYRSNEETYAAHCEECKAIFTWLPQCDKTKPDVKLDGKKDTRCGCGCGR